jgi:hypothetical protein
LLPRLVRSACRSTTWLTRSLRPGRVSKEGRRRLVHPRWLVRHGHRPQDDRPLTRDHQRGRNGVLERVNVQI